MLWEGTKEGETKKEGGKAVVADSKQEKEIWPIQTMEKCGNWKLQHTVQSTRERTEVVFPHIVYSTKAAWRLSSCSQVSVIDQNMMSYALIAKLNVLVLRGKMPSKQPQANQTKPPEKPKKRQQSIFPRMYDRSEVATSATRKWDKWNTQVKQLQLSLFHSVLRPSANSPTVCR